MIAGAMYRGGSYHITAIGPNIDIQFLSDIVSHLKTRIPHIIMISFAGFDLRGIRESALILGILNCMIRIEIKN